MSDDPVEVTSVADEIEADLVCGLLRSAGIECGFRPSGATDAPFGGVLAGRFEVLVHEDDVERARAVIAEAEASAGPEGEGS